MMRTAAAISATLLFCSLALANDFQGATHMVPFDEGAITYSKTPGTGPVARLQERMDKGEVTLQRDEQFGYLLSILDALKVRKSSQMLVFSKTSFQRERIDPGHPRGVFFGDNVYVGYVPGSTLLEISEADPKLGGVFYTFEQSQTGKLRFARNDQCLECHASAKTLGVPGHLARSFATDENGVVDLSSGTSQVNHRTPFEERWGGWYVTGTSGPQTHRGNLVGKAAFDKHEKTPGYLGNVTNLSRFFDPSPYPLAQSDIVALMVLEHQTHMHNFITRLQYESTIALQQFGHLRYLGSPTESFLKYLLFTEETPLRAAVAGSPEFRKQFESEGPRDRQGRSLREFDLKTRLFKYPCSYLIYSEAFNALPKEMKEKIFGRLAEILSGKDTSGDYANLTPETRRAIADILAETQPDLPRDWVKARATSAP